MGAWGTGPFDNDDAADFAGDLSAGAEISFEEVFDLPDGYIEIREASNVLAAAALVVAAKTGRMDAVPRDLQDWVRGAKDELVLHAPRARDAVRRVREDSELKEAWSDPRSQNDWEAAVSALEMSLS